jgi:hypothetical protein
MPDQGICVLFFLGSCYGAARASSPATPVALCWTLMYCVVDFAHASRSSRPRVVDLAANRLRWLHSRSARSQARSRRQSICWPTHVRYHFPGSHLWIHRISEVARPAVEERYASPILPAPMAARIS